MSDKVLISIAPNGYVEGSCCRSASDKNKFKEEAIQNGFEVRLVERSFAKSVLFENINDATFNA